MSTGPLSFIFCPSCLACSCHSQALSPLLPLSSCALLCAVPLPGGLWCRRSLCPLRCGSSWPEPCFHVPWEVLSSPRGSSSAVPLVLNSFLSWTLVFLSYIPRWSFSSLWIFVFSVDFLLSSRHLCMKRMAIWREKISVCSNENKSKRTIHRWF